MVYDDEIKRELEVGNVYSSTQLLDFFTFNKGTVVLCESTSIFTATEELKYQVTDKLNVFLHRAEDTCYQVPNKKTIMYKVEKV